MRKRRYPVLRGNILGLDLSLRSPAAVVIRPGWRLGVWEDLVVDHHWPDEPEPGFRGQFWRRRRIAERLVAFAQANGVAHVYLEDYAYSRHSSSVTKLAELRVTVENLMHDALGLYCEPVSSSAWRKLLLGKVPRKGAKQACHDALYWHRFPKKWCGDVADAFGVCNYGLTELGLTGLTLA